MTITEKQREELLFVSMPLIRWINENCHPHCHVVVDCTSVELLEGIATNKYEDYVDSPMKKDSLDTAGNRNPEARYEGYKGRPLRKNASQDEKEAWEEGMRARERR